MARQIRITIPDEVLDEVLEAYAEDHRYSIQVAGGMPEMDKLQFAKQEFIREIKMAVKRKRHREKGEAHARKVDDEIILS